MPYGVFLEVVVLRMSRWTHSEVIWATSCREVKPELRKLSLYWLILMAASQSSTELKVLKSGMDLSNSGWEGLEEGEERRGEERRGEERRGKRTLRAKQGFDAILSMEDSRWRETVVMMFVRGYTMEEECLLYEYKLWKVFWPAPPFLPQFGLIHSPYFPT